MKKSKPRKLRKPRNPIVREMIKNPKKSGAHNDRKKQANKDACDKLDWNGELSPYGRNPELLKITKEDCLKLMTPYELWCAYGKIIFGEDEE